MGPDWQPPYITGQLLRLAVLEQPWIAALNNDAKTGFVAIGRNEGERLEMALTAIKRLHPTARVVYVDSGSTDNSVAFAQALDYQVVELDMSIPFTAARARNAGYQALLEVEPDLEFIQFLDGDCELQAGWLEQALALFAEQPTMGICSGRRVERYPEHSIYNQLMDIEWNTPTGEVSAVLGDMCVRVAALKAVDGFDAGIIAAEDDDFCLRVAAAGYGIYRIDAVMSYHDANITRLSQWYKRSKRGGHGYANINRLHGGAPQYYFRRQIISVCVWGAVVPALFVTALFAFPLLAATIFVLYSVAILKTGFKMALNGFPAKVAFSYAALIYTGKVAEFAGIFEYWKNSILSRQHVLIEYK